MDHVAALGFAIGPYAGKETGETALFRQLWKSLFSGDIVVGDRYFASYWDLAMLSARRVANRPNRYEPRAIKRRPKPHDLLTVPRSQAKRLLAQ